MKELLKYLGVFLVLIGVVIFIVYAYSFSASNTYLICGMTLVILGVISHIVLNKVIKD